MEELLVIMVVEDDQAIQTMVEVALADGGFEPAIAASGEEAVTLLKGGLTKYRALVTDINPAGTMDGWEVARHAREIDPEFPIVYMTGASADEYGSQGVPNSILLNKPFAPAQLVTAVSQLLNIGKPTTRGRSGTQLRRSAAMIVGVDRFAQAAALVPDVRNFSTPPRRSTNFSTGKRARLSRCFNARTACSTGRTPQGFILFLRPELD